jgi:HEPN domain-containing protein
MPGKESPVPADWFAKAERDVQTAELLWREKGYAEIVGFHLQQGVEKSLKGFLLSKKWKLKRVHDLVALLNEAVGYEASLEPFRSLCQELTEFYIEERYPFMIASNLTHEAIAPLLPKARSFVAKLREFSQ